MKKIISILILAITMLVFTQEAGAHGWGHRYYRPHAYCAPAPYYRPYYAPPAYRDIWVRPHWRHTPYGREWVPGHWVRERVY